MISDQAARPQSMSDGNGKQRVASFLHLGNKFTFEGLSLNEFAEADLRCDLQAEAAET